MYNELMTFASCLAGLGYGEILSSIAPTERSVGPWIRLKKQLGSQDEALVDLLLFGENVPEEKCPPELLDCIRPLCEIGLFRIQNGFVRTSGFSLNLVQGIWLFHEVPNARISLYFGDDSFALLNHQLPRPGGTCLDLCAGPGIQGLYAARSGERVTTVELNPIAADLAKVNAMLNGLYERMDIRKGNLYAPIGREERFDRIVANPPLLPFPKELPYTIVGHGGDDGFGVTGPILDGCARHLKDGGYAQLLGLALGNGRTPLCLPLLENIAKRDSLDVQFTVVKHLSISPKGDFFHSLAATSSAFSGLGQETIEEIMEQCYASQGATEFLCYYIFLQQGQGKLVVRDLNSKSNSLWYVK